MIVAALFPDFELSVRFVQILAKLILLWLIIARTINGSRFADLVALAMYL